MAHKALKRPGSKAFYPASTTHSRQESEERHTTEVTGDWLRLAPGIKDFEGIRADIEPALAKA